MKLELKHLAPYLPYELHGIIFYTKTDFEKTKLCIKDGLNNEADIASWLLGSYQVKPILRPLADLNSLIEVNNRKFYPIDELAEIDEVVVLQYSFEFFETSMKHLPHWIVQQLLEWHFDVFGLIEQGLAISIHDVG
jgi:hypothetical protein